ncbi:hypothetical protein SESBI_01242 [Sesbania bispinosa]|nr:hypothetical protein SESBI_01242 [Sesbania bispinosa]
MENQQPSDAKRAMEQELIEGRETANQLLEILVHKSNTHNHHGDLEGIILLPFARDLVHKVLRSFTNTLLLLNTNSEEVKVLPTTITNVSSSASCPKPEDKDEASRSFTNAKNRRGCYKRK